MADSILDRLPFPQIYVEDAEYTPDPGNLPNPVCCFVVKELRSGTVLQRWTADGGVPSPYDTGPSSLTVFHYGVAECLSRLALGWPLPRYAIDTCIETRVLQNGLPNAKSALHEAAGRRGIATISAAAKEAGRQLAMKGPPWDGREQDKLTSYCKSDVETTAELFIRMLPEILAPEFGFQHALIRARHIVAVAIMEQAGITLDVELLLRLQANWAEIRQALIVVIDPGRYDCYENGTFKQSKFEQLLIRMGLARHWPRTPFGRYATDDETFKDMSNLCSELRPLYELHQTLNKLKSINLAIGRDGRHRAESLKPFATDTGRNAPTGFVYSLSRWTRHMIKPGPGMAVVYSDYSSQEIYCAAAQSQDPKLKEAINSGDPYMYFARETKLAPPDATKYTHTALRDKLKPFMLGMNYGMTAKGVASKTGTSFEEAAYVLVPKHRALFKVYWSDAFSRLYRAVDRGHVRSRFGWHMHVTSKTKYTSLLNHPIQTAGADILRLACIGLTEIGIKVVAPIHDAVLTECRIEEVDEHVATVQRVMRLAAKVGIGIEIPVESAVTRWPDRYHEAKGAEMFETIMRLLTEIEQRRLAA